MKNLTIHNFPTQDTSKNKLIFNPVAKSWPGTVYSVNSPKIVHPGHPIMMWGLISNHVQEMLEYNKLLKPYYYVDMGYFRRLTPKMDLKDSYWRITRDSFVNHRFIERPGDRWDKLGIAVQDWKSTNNDKHIIICSGSRAHQTLMGDSDWVKNTVAHIKTITNRPIIIRSKPGKQERDTGSPGLVELFKNAHAVVTQASQAAVEAAIAGIPVFVHPNSHAWMLGSTDLNKIENPEYPDRRPGLYHIAYSQFTIEEIENGYMWSVVKN